MGIGEQYELEKTGCINHEHAECGEQTVEANELKICTFYEGCRYRIYCEGCPDNCGKYTPPVN
ncbi:hypothetical protein LCGC14_0950250 [marine sediment metagenome]|uniref:Uncharacterized protein n=1 Tax=marine sediment metagenome TaxID=412755 RepID=A0A0F9R0X6_9ZZZZ